MLKAPWGFVFWPEFLFHKEKARLGQRLTNPAGWFHVAPGDTTRKGHHQDPQPGCNRRHLHLLYAGLRRN